MNNLFLEHNAHFILDTLFEKSADIMLMIDKNNKVLDMNIEAENYFSCLKSDAINKEYAKLCATYHKEPMFALTSCKSYEHGDFSVVNIEAPEQIDEIEWSLIRSETDQNDKSLSIIIGKKILKDIVLNKEMNEQLHKLAQEKNQAEADNKTISQYLQDIISAVPGSIYWKNKEGIYLGCNDYMVQTAGFNSKSDIIGKSDYELWPQQAALFRETDQNVMRNGQTISLEEEVILPNGKKRLFIVGKMPLKDIDGNINGIIGNSLEITNLKETQLALEAANRAKTEFIANMGHDIRTPLTGVIGLSEALEAELENPKQKQFANIIRESGNQLLGLLNDILDVISTDHINEHDIHDETFNLYECIQSIANLGRSSTHKKGIDLLIHIDKNIPAYIISDRIKLHRVLLNLLSNSIKFTEKGQIELSALLVKQDSDQITLRFSVKDTGIGIAKDQQVNVFDRFFRGNPSYQGIYKGNGIGLHIAQTYVTLLGGNIQFTSQEGVGTTFYFDLSFKIGEKTNATLPVEDTTVLFAPSPKDLSNNTSNPHVLLVEDNAVALMVIENLITQAHLRYISATDAESALMFAKIHEFDLIITDLGLPGMSGIELTKEIRAWERAHHRPPVPIIGLSAHTREEALTECLPSGMNDGFSKPITKDLIHALKNTYIITQNTQDASVELSPISKTIEAFGDGVPYSEEELFKLNHLELFDAKLALTAMSNNVLLLPEILKDFLAKDLPESLIILQEAYEDKNWDKIVNRVHYMKSTLNFTGTPRMKTACLYLERYKKAGHHALLDRLYHQLTDISELTKQAILSWMKHVG